MATHTMSRLMGISRTRAFRRLSMPRRYSLYTPDYLETGKSKIPLHTTLNVQIKSYGFPVLESYQKFIDGLATDMNLEVDDSWAFPPKCWKITRLKQNSSVVELEYELNEYERNIQIENVSATQYPVLLRMMEAALPEGVTLTVEYWDPIRAEKRYVPDREILVLKEELDNMRRK